MNFEWDEPKNQANLRKHGIDFREAKLVFNDFNAIFFEDERFDYGEVRYVAIGQLEPDSLNKIIIVVVVYTEKREDLIRIISVRKANKREVRLYEQQSQW